MALIALGAMTLLWGSVEATFEPIVRTAKVAMSGWPVDPSPLKALLISDIHVAGPDMPPERLRGIVARINGIAPDLVLIAGDFVSDKRASTRHYSLAEAIAPFAGLRVRLGTFAVLGNHDHWRNAAEAKAALRSAGVTLLENDAVVAGPLVIGGLDDDFTRRADLPATLGKMQRLRGAKLLLSHSPDPFPDVPPEVPLMLAGHTHCGQVSLPLIGPLSTMSRYGRHYACGLVGERGKTLIVTAGLGTSGLPLRIGAPPDMWLIELGPKRRSTAALRHSRRR
jgi:predicted MPP superfamily phosphohydrolase